MFLTKNQDLIFLQENLEDIKVIGLSNGNVELVNIMRPKESWVK